jgi:hypothetical protein
MRLGRNAGPIIEHRVNQVLEREAILVPVPRQQRQGGCKTGDNGCKGKNSCKGKGGCASKT